MNSLTIAFCLLPLLAPETISQQAAGVAPQVETSAVEVSKKPKAKPSKHADRILNINFAMAPVDSQPRGVIGGPGDVWTLIDVRETTKSGLPMASGTPTDVVLQLSENDGEWGIPGSFDVYHAYLYHNCRCVDLSVTLTYLPEGIYEAYVFAHGDAPDQNAMIEIESGGITYTGQKTLNDGSHRYRSRDYEAGNQYVKYTIEVKPDSPVVITSKRDGSSLSMFNAIQLKRLRVK
ncbi:hypothetical protein Pan97_09910 [Bremerella volcania]|uniref:Uncharacterized protein n=1 Tax=Bremerella volcania TaxID=2527984 RepID=A0A518C459_9BACT|nr:hypothetical protein [Bremerella volcania]QDU73991.1 hypothetical protein Pan97_09910 [Bremerella volcania]